MEWLQAIIWGLICGLTEFLPISSQGHQALMAVLFGQEGSLPLLQLVVHVACLAALLVCSRRDIGKLRREMRLLKIPSRRRARAVDLRSVMTVRLMKTAVMPMLVGFVFYPRASTLAGKLIFVAIFMVINGLLLFFPQHIKNGNKDARTMSRLDGFLIGLAGALSVLPGISRIGAMLSAAMVKGAEKNQALSFALLLSIPALVVLLVFDVMAVASSMEAVSAMVAIKYLLTAAAAYLGSSCAIFTMRSLAVKTGFSGFAYYSWGAALFILILYLTT